MARLIAVGVGPGDPELLTRKAERILRGAPVICAPTGATDASSIALTIAEPFLDRTRQEILVQVFPMRKEPTELDPFWQEAATVIAERISRGLDVAFITLGDPMLYSTFLYLHRIFQERFPEIPIDIVPGISSITAAAAAAGWPLAVADERVAILPATYEEERLRQTLVDFDTVVLMKVHRVFDRIYPLLVELHREKYSVFVRRVGTPEEEVTTDLAALVGKKLDYLSLLIVKKPAPRERES